MERRRTAFLLEELCVDLGFCLPPDAQARLIDEPPDGIDEFTDAVIQAEGLDPSVIPRPLRSAVRERVARYLQIENQDEP